MARVGGLMGNRDNGGWIGSVVQLRGVMLVRAAAVLVGICLLPTILYWLGVDFGSPAPIATENVASLEGVPFEELIYRDMSGNFTHTLLEWTITVISLFTIVLAIAHFVIVRDVVTPVVALALLAAGTMDGFHVLAADRLISASADNKDLIPFTWAVCRTFNAVLPLAALLVLYFVGRSAKVHRESRSIWIVSGWALFLIVVSVVLIRYCTLSETIPQTMFPDATITRPWDVYPLIIYLLSGLVFYPLLVRSGARYFAMALWLSVIPDVATQLHMVFGSTSLFDHHFNVAHALKILGYAIPCFGLVFEYVQTHRSFHLGLLEREKASKLALVQLARLDEKTKKLESSEARVRAIIDTAYDTVVVIDERGVVESVNPSVEREFGFAPEELIGKNINMLMPESDRGEHDHHLANYRESGVSKIIGTARSVRAQRKDGSEFSVSLSVGEMVQAGEPMFVGILRDITKEEEAKRERAALLRELHRSNEDLEKFAYVASHDLQEPLRMISSYTYLLQEDYGGKLGEEADEYIAFAVDGARRMQSLIEDLLQYSKVGQNALKIEETDCQELVSIVKHDLTKLMDDSGAELLFEGLPKIHAEPALIRRLFQNLISNGMKFRGKKAPVVEIKAEREGKLWIFSVKDNGIGFDMKFKTRVFEIFQRLHTRQEYKGSGMGLAICKRIVHRQGGEIWVQSELGRGTTVSFSLPSITHE